MSVLSNVYQLPVSYSVNVILLVVIDYYIMIFDCKTKNISNKYTQQFQLPVLLYFNASGLAQSLVAHFVTIRKHGLKIRLKQKYQLF